MIMPRSFLGCQNKAEIMGFFLVYRLFQYQQWFFHNLEVSKILEMTCAPCSGNKGTVKAFLDGEEIGSAGFLTPNQVVEFTFNHGSELLINEHDTAVIQFNSLEILNCDSCN